jgi:glycosyltransferase involved in cell wall biosynthesis
VTKTEPLVSVICLCYNHEKFVREALLSVLNQTYSSLEIIIVNDSSTDNSLQIVEQMHVEFPQLKIIHNKQNLGITASFNKAFAISKGKYILDFATDDVLLPHAIATLVAEAQKHEAAVVYANSERISESGAHLGYFFAVDENKRTLQKIPRGLIYESIVNSGEIVNPVALLVSRNIHVELGGYNDSLAYEDLDFWLRASRDYPFFYIDQTLSQKRYLEHSLGYAFKEKSVLGRRINASTFKTLWMAFTQLNRSKSEHRALLKRVHYEMGVVYRNGNLRLWIPYLLFKTAIHFKILISR